jgi:hypothetical protein
MARPLITDLDFYRIGDTTGPGLDAVRVSIDIAVTSRDGIDGVSGSPNGGASVRASIYRLRRTASQWWRLPRGSAYSAELMVRNDHGGDWLIEPEQHMPLRQYRELVREVNPLLVFSLVRLVSG